MRDKTVQPRFESVSKHSNYSLLARGNTLQSDEDIMKLNELMDLGTNLQTRVLDLEKTKTTQSNEIASLKRRVKKLEKKSMSRTHKLKRLYKDGLTARVESSDDEESLDMFDVDDLGGEEVFVVEQEVVKDVNENVIEEVVNAAQDSTATATITAEEITLAQALKALKTLKPKDKGKGIMIEEHVKPKKKDQIRLDEKAAKRFQAEFDEKERLAREKAQKEQEKRRKHFVAKRVEEKRNKPPTQAQQRKIMCTYLKNMEGYKLNDLKLKEFDSIKEKFDRAFRKKMKYGRSNKDTKCWNGSYMTLVEYFPRGRIVGIKSLFDAVGITAAHVRVSAAYEEITLVSVQDEVVSNDADKEMFDVDVLDGEECCTTTTTTIITVGNITLAQALNEIKSTKPKEKGIVIQELGKSTTKKSSKQSQDKGKRILIEPVIEPMKPMKRKDRIRLDEEAALKLQAAFDEEERLAREKAEKDASSKILKEFDYIQEMFKRAFKRVNTFEDFRTELVEGKEKRAGTELIQEITKKQKVEDDKEITELKPFMEIILDEKEVAINVIPLSVKEDLEGLYKLVKANYESTRPVEDLDLLLWGDLKSMFEPHVKDEIYMLVEKKYPLTPSTLSMMLEKKLIVEYESKMAYQLLRFIMKQLKK
nr:hypothetical protein [Tanacetum cinerariifolium]